MPVRDIIDQPGPLPGEIPGAPAPEPEPAPIDDSMPAKVTALCEAYNVSVLDYQDGRVPRIQLSPDDWSDVVHVAHNRSALCALRVTLGNAWCSASVDLGGYCVTITTAPDVTKPRVLLDLEGL